MTDVKKVYNKLESNLIDYYRNNESELKAFNHPSVLAERERAFELFCEKGMPSIKDERWKNTRLDKQYSTEYILSVEPEQYSKSVSEIFLCEIHGFYAEVFSMLNGWYYSTESQKLKLYANGVIAGSLLEAQQKYPGLIEKYFGKVNTNHFTGFASANAALFTDGLFVYVPKNVEFNNTIQLIKMINREENLLINSRNLIILEEGSRLSFMHCDDSINHFTSLINTVTEIHIGPNASLDLYKLQNINDQTTLINNTFIRQERDSRLNIHVLTLNGGVIRNEFHVDLAGEGSDADIKGFYLMDKNQHIDNQVNIKHLVPNCSSSELFKGVLDNSSRGVFNGYIYVARDAQKTNAFQRNNNILLSPEAKIDTMPFLEIYADDVKCSHGATVGQLDEEAMFYMMQRGISREDARLLLMYAFIAEVTSSLAIEPLRVSIEDMIKKRLRGELSICEKCVLHCSIPDKPIEFEIDMSKV